MNYFESKLVKALTQYITENNLPAIAYRSKQAKYSLQFFDILVDSGNKDYYLAIECKSSKIESIFFSKNFRPKQIENLELYSKLSGRNCFLAVKWKKDISLIPWAVVYEIYQTKKSIPHNVLIEYIINLKDQEWLKQHLYFHSELRYGSKKTNHQVIQIQ